MSRRLRIWIDLENPPHVPFFAPIIEVLRGLGHEVVVTARDFAGTLELTEHLGIEFEPAVSFFDGPLAELDAALVSRGFLQIVSSMQEVSALRVARNRRPRPMKPEGSVIGEIVAGLLDTVRV